MVSKRRLDFIKMPRQYDKYGFNRQYLRRPVRRKSPFPHRLPFCDGFSTRALMHKVVSAPPSKSASVPQDNVPSKPGAVPGDLTRREPLPFDGGRNHYKRMRFTEAMSRFIKREVVDIGRTGTTAFIASEMAEVGGPPLAFGTGLATFGVVMAIETAENVVHLGYDLIHKKQTEFKRPSPYGPSKHRGHNFRVEGLD